MAITLRLVCCVAPYAVAGVRFGRGPTRAYGVIQRPIDQFSEADLHELFTDPRVDVSVGVPHEGGDWAFVPVTDALDLVRVRQLIEAAPAAETAPTPPQRGTMDILAEHARLEAERARDAAAPGGDDEDHFKFYSGHDLLRIADTTTAVDGADAQAPSEGTTANIEAAARETTAAPAPGAGDGEVAREQGTGGAGESTQPAADPAPAPVAPPARPRRQPAKK